MDELITARDVSKGFPLAGGETFWALKHINLSIPAGKLTILRGRSGSGKTTLMNMLSALDRPTEGTIIFRDRILTELRDRQRDLLRRAEIGFVFQSVALIPTLSAYENVEFSLRMARFPVPQRRQRVEECLNMVGLGGRMNHMPQEMSGGEQQRVAIARAMAHRPKVIFADEPTAELDSQAALQVMKIFRDLTASEGITVVMTTHDTGLMELGDLVYQIEDGELLG